MTTRADIVAAARAMIDTPFHHAARQPGLAIDCAGVWVCAARSLALVGPDFDVPAYGPVPDGRTLIKWCKQFMGRQLTLATMQSGDGIVVITDQRPQHMGVLGDYRHGGLSIIHASNAAHPPRVIETRLMFSRSQRFVAAFAFPGID